MLRIHRTTDGTITVLAVSGRLDADNINELRQSLEMVPADDAVALDLADLPAADVHEHATTAVAAPACALVHAIRYGLHRWLPEMTERLE